MKTNPKFNSTHLLAVVWLFITSVLLTHNAYLWFGKHITPNTDILALLPTEKRDPVVQAAFNHLVDTAQQRLVVLIGAESWPQAASAADAYVAVINTAPELIQLTVTSAGENTHDWLALFTKSRLGLLTANQQIALKNQPKQYWVDTAINHLYSPFIGLKLGAWQDDPFSLFSDWVQARAQETPVRPRDGKLYIEDKKRAYAVVLMQLQQPVFAIATQKMVIPLLEQAKAAAQQIAPQVAIITTGVVLHAAAASEQARHEMSTIGFGSLMGIVLLMWLTFRSVKPILFIGLSIGVGCLGAFSICWLLFGQIHLLTLVFGASLIGIAQDYGIYFLCSRVGASTQLNAQALLRSIMPGLCLTLVAALIGYLGLGLTPFPGLQQMAAFSGFGLLFAWLTVVCWFPKLIHPHTLTATQLAQRYGATRAQWPRIQLNSQALLLGLLFCGYVAIGWSKLTVSDDIRTLQKASPILIADQIKLTKLLDTPSPVQFYLVRGATQEMVLQREEALKFSLEPLISQHVIRGYQAISNWVPSLQTQLATQQLINNKLLIDNGPLRILAHQLGEDDRWINQLKHHLLTATILLTPEDFLKTPANEPWQFLWLGKIGNEYASIVAIRGLNNYANLPLLKQIATQLKGVQWIDKVEEISSVLSYYRQYMHWILVCAYLAIYCLLFIRYRKNTWRILLPPALASISTLALLGIIGSPLQLFHVLALMLILGLGVDYGIFLQEHPNRQDYFAWLTVGLSAISALLSFGLLALSHTPPLHAFGLTMLIGMAIIWLLAPCFGKTNN